MKDSLGDEQLGAEQPEQRVQVRRAGARGVRRAEPGRSASSTLQGGLRAEYANRDFQLASTKSYPYHYTSLFPSGVLSYNLTT